MFVKCPSLCCALAVALVYNAERINALAGRHWQRFARQDYFDKSGVFAGVLLGAPLLLTMFVILVVHLHTHCITNLQHRINLWHT